MSAAVCTEALTAATFRGMQKRLDTWELDHLREHAADLAARLEAAEARIAEAERRCEIAEDSADRWHDFAIELQRGDAAESRVVGLSMDGSLHVLGARLVTNDFGDQVEVFS